MPENPLPPPSISLRSLAKAAGVSLGTASQALTGTGTTSVKTRERIRRLAQELGYRPDPLMSRAGAGHRSGQRGRIAIPVGFLRGFEPTDRPSHPKIRFRDECQEVLAANGFEFCEAIVSSMSALHRVLREWYHRGVQGIFLSNLLNQSWFGPADWSAFSVVYLGGHFYTPVFNTVCLNYPQALDQAINLALNTPGRVGIVLHSHSGRQVFDDCLREGVAHQHQRTEPTRFTPMLPFTFGVPFAEQVTRLGGWLDEHQPAILVGFSLVNVLLEACPRPRPVPPLVIPTADYLPPGCIGGLESSRELVTVGVNLLEGMIRRQERGIPTRPGLTTLVPPLVQAPGDS